MNKINSNVIQSQLASELASFQKLFDIHMSYIHVSFPAIVEKLHNRNGINYYDVRPIILPFNNNYEGETPSLVLEVPAGRNGNGKCGDKWKYNEQDRVWVICADKSITNIMENWQPSTTNVYKSHTLEGSFILCCIDTEELQNYIEYTNDAINITHTKEININANKSCNVKTPKFNVESNNIVLGNNANLGILLENVVGDVKVIVQVDPVTGTGTGTGTATFTGMGSKTVKATT